MRPENSATDPVTREDESSEEAQHEDLRLDTEVLEGPHNDAASGVAGGTGSRTIRN